MSLVPHSRTMTQIPKGAGILGNRCPQGHGGQSCSACSHLPISLRGSFLSMASGLLGWTPLC